MRLFNGKIRSRLQIALFFLIYQNFQSTPPLARLIRTPTYLVLPNVPTLPTPAYQGLPFYSESQSKVANPINLYEFFHQRSRFLPT